MKKSFYLTVVTPEKTLFSNKSKRIDITGIEGEMTILPQHSPLITIIKPGMIKIFSQKKEIIYVSGGILEVQPDTVIVLADTAIISTELDEEKILQTKIELEKNIKFNNKKNITKYLIKLDKTIAKLKIIELMKNKKHSK